MIHSLGLELLYAVPVGRQQKTQQSAQFEAA